MLEMINALIFQSTYFKVSNSRIFFFDCFRIEEVESKMLKAQMQIQEVIAKRTAKEKLALQAQVGFYQCICAP